MAGMRASASAEEVMQAVDTTTVDIVMDARQADAVI